MFRMLKLSEQKKRAHNTLGVTAIEYGLIAAGIGVAIIAVVNIVSGKGILEELSKLFN